MLYSTNSIVPDSLTLAKRDFHKKLRLAKTNQEDWTKETTGIMAEYLKDVYQINIPEDFAHQLACDHCVFHAFSRGIEVTERTIDTIVKSCSLWKDYLDDTDASFSNLVCNEVLSMVRIHTSVIAGRNISEVPGVSLKETPPYLKVTIVTLEGALRVIS